MKIKNLLKFIKFLLLKIKYASKYVFTTFSQIKVVIKNYQNCTLFITHNLGGGTKQFEYNYIKSHCNNVIVLRIISYGFDICYSIEDGNENKKLFCKIRDLDKLLMFQFKCIVVNSLVSSSRVKNILNNVIACKKNSNIPVIYMVHDYHSVCPRFNLVANDDFCKLNCNKLNCKFRWFGDCTNMNISDWRKYWKTFLSQVDEIRCFSKSSKKILQSCYEDLAEDKFRIMPHSMDYCNFSKLSIQQTLPLKILIIGACHTIPKGRKVIEYLIKNLDKRINITLIGTDYKAVSFKKDDSVSFYGRYNHSDLPNIIEKSNGSLIIFPSIWPETFSYLVSELMMMNLPIMCFNYGAQAEKIKEYSKGLLCKDAYDMIEKIYLYEKIGDEIFNYEK